MDQKTLSDTIIKNALHFQNMFEVKSNAQWEDPESPHTKTKSDELRALMQAVGWKDGWPYCSSFCEAIWRKSYQDLNAPKSLIDSICSKLNPSSTDSYNNFKIDCTNTPKPGAIFFMRKGNTSLGHEGLVISISGTTLSTIEGNTSAGKVLKDSNKDREGDGVFKKTRVLDLTPSKSKLFLRGFLNPILW